jgi:hypothetical protein
MSEKTYRATISPQRSDPNRYAQIVVYDRRTDDQGDFVVPLRLEVDRWVRVEYHEIHPCPVDPEFEVAWVEHVRRQERAARFPVG